MLKIICSYDSTVDKLPMSKVLLAGGLGGVGFWYAYYCNTLSHRIFNTISTNRSLDPIEIFDVTDLQTLMSTSYL